MRRSIASLVLAAIAVLVVTVTVAAADPFGWRHNGMANGATMSRDVQTTCCSIDRTYSAPAASARPTITPGPSQTHPTPTVRPAAARTDTHHSSRTNDTQPSHHGSDWCDFQGMDR